MRIIVRVIKVGLLAQSELESYFSSITNAQEDVDRCLPLVDTQSNYTFSL